MRIVFYGTPEFAVPSLKGMVESGYEVAAVVTAPDKPAGRGLLMQHSAVKEYAMQVGLPVLQPTNMKSPVFITQLQAIKPDLQVVIAFRMMPEAVWAMPRLGTFNLHGSFLPQYRGAAPINRAIMNGETETGLTTFFINHQIDTGNILLQQKIAIAPNETAGQLHDHMMLAGADLVVKSLGMIANGKYQLTQQTEAEDLQHAPKVFKTDCEIDWNKDIQHVFNQIRGLSPYPAAFTSIDGQQLKIFVAETKSFESKKNSPGAVETDGKTYFKIAASDGLLDLKDVQLAGKKRLSIVDFLRGFHAKSAIAGQGN